MIKRRSRRPRSIAGLILGGCLILSGTARAASAQMISSVSPVSGPSGTAVTITGSGFGKSQGSGTVRFNGVSAPVAGWLDSQVVATVPEGATTGPIVITVGDEPIYSEDPFRVIIPVSPPELSSLFPDSSPLHADATGSLVTLRGSGFGGAQESSTVTMNGTPAAVVRWSDTEIRAAIPDGATTGPVVVTVGEEPSKPLPLTVYPYAASLSPASGPAGSEFTLHGTHFGPTQGSGKVTLNGVPVPVVRWMDTEVTAIVPQGGTTGPVVVTVNGAASNGNQIFSVRSVLRPTISSLFPESGPSGGSVIITGSGFGGIEGPGIVTFNGTRAAVLGWMESQVIATVPDGATTGPVVVTIGGVRSDPGPIFTSTSDSPFSLAAIRLTPEHPALVVGQVETFTATGTFKNGAAQPLSLATLAAGIGHTCAVLSEGTVNCWGENAFGQLGIGSTVSSAAPARVVGIQSATAVAAGGAHACALLSEGSVRCWGDNAVGQLGNGSTTGSAVPVEVTGIRDAVAIAAEGNYSCASLSDGTRSCWGVDRPGPLGSGNVVDSTSPVRVSGLPGGAPAAAGETATCSLSEGTVSCWGDNTFGQLGNGTAAGSITPVRVGGIGGALAIAAGSYHTCTVLTNGTMRCWGAGVSGQLGDGKTAGSSAPVTVNGMKSAAAVVWASSNAEVATIDSNGRVTALRPGLTTISATSRGLSGRTTLLVEPSERPAAVSSSAGPVLAALESGNEP